MKGFSTADDTSCFHSDTYREKIKNVSFVNYIDTTNKVESWDMSEKGNSSIVAWVTNNETEGYYDLFIGSNYEIYAKNLSFFFERMTSVDSIVLDNLNTSLTNDMLKMFNQVGYNSTVFTLELGNNFNTSNVTDMAAMFQG